MRHRSKGASTLLWVVVAIIALSALGVVNLQNLAGGVKSATTGSSAQQGPFVPTQAAGFICQTDGTNSFDVAVPNSGITAGSDYTATSVAAIGTDGTAVATGTSTGGASLSYLTLNIPCGAGKLSGRVCAVTPTSGAAQYVNGKCIPYDLSQKLNDQGLIPTWNATNLTLVFRSTALANTSTSAAQSTTENGATTMGSGDSRSGYLDIVNTTIGSAMFGSETGGILITVDTADSSVFSDKAVSLGVASGPSGWTLTEVTCPAQALSFNSGNRCYRAPAVRSSDGLIRLSWNMVADLGNPGTSADPIIYLDDVQSFVEDGVFKENVITNKAGTTVGAARNSATFDNS